MSGIFDYVLRHNKIEFIGDISDPPPVELRRWPNLPTDNVWQPVITLRLAKFGLRLTPREAIVLGNALIDIGNNKEHWRHPTR